MMVSFFRCTRCSSLYFPARLRCHACGSFEFKSTPIDRGQVKAVTRVHRIPENCQFEYLVQVEVEKSAQVIAAAFFSPSIGTSVAQMHLQDGAICISEILTH